MSWGRRKGFVLGVAIFSIFAVGTLVVVNKLVGLIMFSLIDFEQAGAQDLPILLTGVAILLITTIVVPTFATRVLLRKFP